MKIITVVGARPQFIKASTISKELVRLSGVEEILIHTGQHYDDHMSDVFFREMGIPTPKYNLRVGSKNHGVQTGDMLAGIESILQDEQPDCVLVYGDTNSTLAGALAAVKLHIPVAHIEAGLRSHNRRMPEEINRVVTDHISTHLFAPSELSRDNLLREGIPSDCITVAGDVMFDATLAYRDMCQSISNLPFMASLSDKYILATIHRAENTDNRERLDNIFSALCTISRNCSRTVVVPIHPRTRNALASAGLLQNLNKVIHILEPVSYLEMLSLEKSAELIVTDSGGVQKEAYYHRIPSVILRTETEWPELVHTGWSMLAEPTSEKKIVRVICEALNTGLHPRTESRLFGDGRAAEQIVSTLTKASVIRRGTAW